MSKYRRPETDGLDEGFFRHYRPTKNYYSNATDKHSIKSIRKKTNRATFFNIIIILILFLGAQFLFQAQGSKKTKHVTTSGSIFTQTPDLSSYHINASYLNQIADIQLHITPINSNIEEVQYPIDIALQWQGAEQPFITYRILDDALWDSALNTFIIRHKEPALLNAKLIVSIYEQSHVTVLSAIVARKES
ncbi:hypothetical protein PVA45_05415 [Entomospira entomophila]|uniref:Uncharacterized protein n=1 Tax=Entomospira entomophila TaxID=2719988 RepID=A0A968KT08_9SPIO|nr:hypothetical protein [Entomospira entomophilus]NIZ40937.1 hypothetical protein [Entomospira entomophilus]WDI35150.1 hypothetical protein PVA45_05415 [Entomospira entomophilus]